MQKIIPDSKSQIRILIRPFHLKASKTSWIKSLHLTSSAMI